jgi:hypothetical protein
LSATYNKEPAVVKTIHTHFKYQVSRKKFIREVKIACKLLAYQNIFTTIRVIRVRVRVRVRVSPYEKILRGWCSKPERTGILNIHELACAYPYCNAETITLL